MTRRQRRYIFYFFILVFLLFGTGVVFFAKGWRFDFKTVVFKKVGAIYVRTFPENTSLTLDDNPVKTQSGFFQSGTLINNLFPKTHILSISASGFHPWQRKVEVLPALVTEVKYAVLVPQQTELVLQGPLTDFWLAQGEILTRNNKNELSWRGQKIPGADVLGFTNNERRLLVKDAKNTLFWVNLDEVTWLNLSSRLSLLLPKENFNLFVDPFQDNKVLVKRDRSLAVFDIQRNTLKALTPTSTLLLGPADASRFWVAWTVFDPKAKVSKLMRYDKFLERGSDTLQTLPGKTKKLAWAENSTLGILEDDGSFYLYNVESNSTSKLASDVLDFSFNENGDMVAALESKGIEVFSFRGEKDYWRFKLPPNHKITALNWYKDDHHLFLVYEDKAVFLELDDLAQENLVDLSGRKAKYDPDSNRLYLISRESLLSASFPKP